MQERTDEPTDEGTARETDKMDSRVRLTTEAILHELGITDSDVANAVDNVVQIEGEAWGGYWDDKFDWTGEDPERDHEHIVHELSEMHPSLITDAIRMAIEEELREVPADD
jgi:hypothetical protein